MNRRSFLKSSCNICAFGSAGLMLPGLSGCAVTQGSLNTEVVEKKIHIPLQLFDKSSLQMVRPKGWYYDIAVQKNDHQNYTAILMQCTHQENQLTKEGSRFYCSLHGSQFDLSGKVKKGPATETLVNYATSISNNELIIHL